MVGKWNDKRVVTFISTDFENDMVDFRTRRQTVLRKPLPIIQYNAYLSGEWIGLTNSFLTMHVTMRWYKKIIIHIFQMKATGEKSTESKFTEINIMMAYETFSSIFHGGKVS